MPHNLASAACYWNMTKSDLGLAFFLKAGDSGPGSGGGYVLPHQVEGTGELLPVF